MKSSTELGVEVLSAYQRRTYNNHVTFPQQDSRLQPASLMLPGRKNRPAMSGFKLGHDLTQHSGSGANVGLTSFDFRFRKPSSL